MNTETPCLQDYALPMPLNGRIQEKRRWGETFNQQDDNNLRKAMKNDFCY